MNNTFIKTIILAAGKGTRMKSSEPKVLHKIFGKALIERVINTVLDVPSTDNIFIIVGHQSEKVTDFINNIYKSKNNSNIECILQEPQLGTGDAVFKAYDKLKEFDGTVLILCGDTPLLTSETLKKFVDSHKSSGSALTVLSAIIDSPQNYGRIVRNSNNQVKKIVEEKDATQEEKQIKEINTGVYCLEWAKISSVFFDLTTNNSQGEYYLTDIVDWACKKNLKVNAFVLNDISEVLGINSRADLAQAYSLMNKRHIKKLMEEGVTIVDPSTTWISPETTIGQDSTVYPGCYIEGNNVIGDNCSIGPFAHIRDNVEIKNHVRIGNFVEVKNSVIDEQTNAAHLSYIGDTNLGKNVNIGAGTITANYNALTKKKSRTIIKDGVKIGSNSVLVAPLTISENANVAAGSVITKDVPESALAIERSPQKILEKWVEKKLKENT